MPNSSRGNYHSVHNKRHNKHLENDFIIHGASIKVSYDPSETHTRGAAEHNCDEMKTILCILWNAYLMVRLCEDARSGVRDWQALTQPWMEAL